MPCMRSRVRPNAQRVARYVRLNPKISLTLVHPGVIGVGTWRGGEVGVVRGFRRLLGSHPRYIGFFEVRHMPSVTKRSSFLSLSGLRPVLTWRRTRLVGPPV